MPSYVLQLLTITATLHPIQDVTEYHIDFYVYSYTCTIIFKCFGTDIPYTHNFLCVYITTP